MHGTLFAFSWVHEQEATEETEKVPISNLCYLCYLGYLLLNFLLEHELG